jgi:HEAT repeat protein
VLAASFLIGGCAEDPIPKLSDELEELVLDRRLIAVARLRDLDDDRAIELLAEALESDEELVDAAGDALAYKGCQLRTDEKPDKVNEALTRIMNNAHLEQPPRAKAAWALGEIGDRESIPSLKGAKSANDAKGVAAGDVRKQATQALEKLGYNTGGRARAMAEDGTVPDRDLDGTPDLEQATEPTAMPEPEEAEPEQPEEAPGTAEGTEAEEAEAPEAGEEATDEQAAPAEPEGESS